MEEKNNVDLHSICDEKEDNIYKTITNNLSYRSCNSTRRHKYKNILFSPYTSEEHFQNHLMRTYKGLTDKKMKSPTLEEIQEKSIKLNTYCKNPNLFII